MKFWLNIKDHRSYRDSSKQAELTDIVLLDYNINPGNRDAAKPLSHAEFVKMYLEGCYPTTEEDFAPLTPDELKQIKSSAKSSKKSSTKSKKTATPEPQTLEYPKLF